MKDRTCAKLFNSYRCGVSVEPVPRKGAPYISSDAAVKDMVVENGFVIVACDGIWDVMTNQECCDALRQLLLEGEKDMGNVAEECLMMCLDKESKDNMSAVVVAFPAAKYGSGPGVAGRAATREARERADEAQGGAAAGQPSRRR